jgi:cytochrome c55X
MKKRTFKRRQSQKILLRAVCLVFLANGVTTSAIAAANDALNIKKLVRVVRQDCGSCHGMKLTGGLGPALTPEALKNMPAESVFATIYHGRPGTPMPPWKNMLSEAEARWIAMQLIQGFPAEGQ